MQGLVPGLKSKGDEKRFGVTVFISKLKYVFTGIFQETFVSLRRARGKFFSFGEKCFVFLSLLVNDCFFFLQFGKFINTRHLFSFPLGDSVLPLDFFSSISANCMQKGNLASDYLDMILIILYM